MMLQYVYSSLSLSPFLFLSFYMYLCMNARKYSKLLTQAVRVPVQVMACSGTAARGLPAEE